jgi:hypothetical protein
MSNDNNPSETTQPIEYTMPTIVRHPNAMPMKYAGSRDGLEPCDQTPDEKLAEDTNAELRNRNPGVAPLPIFNR